MATSVQIRLPRIELWSQIYRCHRPKGAESLRKQVDVFAKDEETVVVAECKASNIHSKRSLQKDIEEFANLKKPIAAAIRKHYGEVKKQQIFGFS